MGAHLLLLRGVSSDALVLENIFKENQADRVSRIFSMADGTHGRIAHVAFDGLLNESERF